MTVIDLNSDVPDDDAPAPDEPPLDPVPKASSNRKITYECSGCGRDVGKDNLRVKRATFAEMGFKGKQFRSRVVAWLCIVPQPDGTPGCLELDEDYNRQSRREAPGLADVIATAKANSGS